MSVVIRYRNPRRPGEAGMILLCDPLLVAETRENLERHGFVVIDDTPSLLPERFAHM